MACFRVNFAVTFIGNTSDFYSRGNDFEYRPRDTVCSESMCELLAVPPWSNSGLGRLIVAVSRSHTATNTAGRTKPAVSPSHRPLPTQQPQETNFHAVSGILPRLPSSQAVADPRFRPRGDRDRRLW